MGLHKTAQGYQEEGIIKLLKYIRDGLAGGITSRVRKVPIVPKGSDDDDDEMMMMMMNKKDCLNY